jgi:hypothetical protein
MLTHDQVLEIAKKYPIESYRVGEEPKYNPWLFDFARDIERASAAPAEGREPADTYKGSNPEIIAQALYCNEHGDTESCENWLHLLRDRLATAPTMSEAARDVLAERRRQIEQEGWTLKHDDEHDGGQLPMAAASYAVAASYASAGLFPMPKGAPPTSWPWRKSWWKPTTPRRDLVKAGALILAEIERIDRAAAKGGSDA